MPQTMTLPQQRALLRIMLKKKAGGALRLAGQRGGKKKNVGRPKKKKGRSP
jgi:hypothetical protein